MLIRKPKPTRPGIFRRSARWLSCATIQHCDSVAKMPSLGRLRLEYTIGAMIVSLGFTSNESAGQVRGLPVFFDATYAYDARYGADVGFGGETDGFVVVGGVSRGLYLGGNCRRLGLGLSTGLWRYPDDGTDESAFVAGTSASYLLNKCRSPTSAPNPVFRLFTGVGIATLADRTDINVPIGLGIGVNALIPIGVVEFFAVPRIHFRKSLRIPEEFHPDLAASGGVLLGLGRTGGLRVAVDCCESGFNWGFGLSLWLAREPI